jgi:hypothetical protein
MAGRRAVIKTPSRRWPAWRAYISDVSAETLALDRIALAERGTPGLTLSEIFDPQTLVITCARCITSGTGCHLIHEGACHE